MNFPPPLVSEQKNQFKTIVWLLVDVRAGAVEWQVGGQWWRDLLLFLWILKRYKLTHIFLKLSINSINIQLIVLFTHKNENS